MIRPRPDEPCRWLTFGLSERERDGVLGGLLDWLGAGSRSISVIS